MNKRERYLLRILLVLAVIWAAWLMQPRAIPKGQSDWPYDCSKVQQGWDDCHELLTQALMMLTPTPTETP